MKRYFRYHKGSLEESLATMKEVKDFEDVEKIVLSDKWFSACSRIETSYIGDASLLFGQEWRALFYVVGKIGKHKIVIGMTNFPKNGDKI